MRSPSVLAPALGLPLAAVIGLAARAADEPPPAPAAGQAHLASGRVVEYTVHFDRNSLRDSLRIGDGLIALTSSGTLLRFELPAVRLVRERIDGEEITCLGRGEGGSVLAGLSDGRICRIDPLTLALTDVARLSDVPQWIGWQSPAPRRRAGLVAVTRATRTRKPNDEPGPLTYSVVHDLAARRTFATEHEATTFLIDRAGRLWLGADNGEWGGRLTRVDLAQGTVTPIKPPARKPGGRDYWQGVYGLAELRDGQVWAYGGSSHMGISSAYVTRIDGDEPEPVFAYQPPFGQEPDPNRPAMPIAQIVEENDGLLVLSYSDVFHVDRALKTWKRRATLEIQYRWGRPDAVGSYPSVCAVHPPARGGEPYVFATVGDGYVILAGAKATPRALAGQLGASGVDRVLNTSEGILALESDDRLPPWALRGKSWEVAPIEPPLEPDPASDLADAEKDAGSWYETSVLVGPDGTITTVSATSFSDGTRTTARRVGGKWVRLGRETSSLDPSMSFLNADGALWNVDSGGLLRFQEGKWSAVPDALESRFEQLYRVESVSQTGPPWLLLDRLKQSLSILTHGPRGESAKLASLSLGTKGNPLLISAAIPWSEDGTVLLATSAGLRTYHPATRRLATIDREEPPGRAQALVRDGLGRLWLGGKHGLWMFETGSKTAESLESVPWIRSSEVQSLAPDPRHKDGIIASLDARGVVFVRALRKP